jgi:hypothetical protein
MTWAFWVLGVAWDTNVLLEPSINWVSSKSMSKDSSLSTLVIELESGLDFFAFFIEPDSKLPF